MDGDGHSVVDAGGGALEHIDGAELRYGAGERINARRKRAGEGWSHLPGGKRIDVIERAEKVDTRGVVDGIFNIYRRRQVHVAGADEIDSVHIHVRNADG